MKKVFHLVVALSFGASLNAFTQEPELPTPADFCVEAEKSLCNREESEERTEAFKKLKQSIADEAMINAKKRYETELPTSGPLLKLRKNIKSTKILNQEIIYSAEKKLGYFEKDIISDANVNIIKKYLNKSINKSALSDKDKEKFKKVLNDEIIVGNYMDFMERTKVTSSWFKQLWRAHCGMDGMTVNAFAAVVDWKKYVLVCPGLLVKLNSLKNSQELTNEIFFVLGHEMAHHFDSSKFKSAYEKMAYCYEGSIAKTLNKKNGNKCPKDDTICRTNRTVRENAYKKKCAERSAEVREKACNFLNEKWSDIRFKRCQKGTGKECLKTVTWAHLGEISADYWATKAIGYYMQDRNFEKSEGVEFLRVNFEILCGSQDEGIHADGTFRSNYMMGKNPTIREQLTCETSEAKYCEI